jgi:membrane protease YdiL (CAAX protease family)
MHDRAQRWAELAGGFALFPLMVGWWVPPAGWIPLLWVTALIAWWLLRQADHNAPVPEGPRGENQTGVLRLVLVRFAIVTVVLATTVRIWLPGRFLKFPLEHTTLWTAVVVLYPLLSVYPQELVYRRFFFRRFSGLLGSPVRLSLASAIAFGWMHLILRNPVAVGLTLVGGWFFAETYRRSGSLRLACLEHSLYGTLVFTVGLGRYIYHGAVRL